MESTTPLTGEGTSIEAFSVSSVISGSSTPNLAALFDENVDDIDAFGVAEIRNAYLDEAHSNALTSPSTFARYTTKRAASAPSITRWSYDSDSGNIRRGRNAPLS